MSWFYERSRPIPTTRNGTMRLMRWFGDWRLYGHDGTEQATTYMDVMWRKAINRVHASPRRALVLGVALGRSFALLRQRWPDIEIVGIDWEPALYALGRELGVHHYADDDQRTRVIFGDAASVIQTLDGQFDLVLVDLFNGRDADKAIFDDDFVETVESHLAPGATVAVNAFKQIEAFGIWQARLGQPQTFRYMTNHVALFSRLSSK